MKTITDRPGRYFAIFIFTPSLVYSAYTVRDNHLFISNLLYSLSFILFFYEIFWICCKDNQTFDVIYINENSKP